MYLKQATYTAKILPQRVSSLDQRTVKNDGFLQRIGWINLWSIWHQRSWSDRIGRSQITITLLRAQCFMTRFNAKRCANK